MNNPASPKRACTECGWHGYSFDVLVAPDPFNDGCDLFACPQCRKQTVQTCCEAPYCWEQYICATLTPRGYRRTCGKHKPAH